MDILLGLEALAGRRYPSPIVTWGVFDGVHRGHAAVLDHAVLWAGVRRSAAVVLTFDPHPETVLTGRPVPLLTPLAARLRLLAARGFAAAVVIPFTKEFAHTSPERFLDGVVVRRLGAAGVVLGFDSAFGLDRRGNLDLLRRIASGRRLEVREVPPLRERGRILGSSAIRADLSAGRLDDVARALGRRFALEAPVVRGDGRGRTLGFPTANLAADGLARPPAGVYGAIARTGGLRRPALVNIGTRPTVTAETTCPVPCPSPSATTVAGGDGLWYRVEAHLLDYDGDLYGRVLEIAFLGRLRDERKFPSVDELRRQIESDRERFRTELLRGWLTRFEREELGIR